MIRSVLVFLLALVAMVPAQDDRDRSTPTATYWNTNQTTANLASLVASGWRFTNIGIESTSPFTFTVAAVPNNGAYAKAWWYSIGVTQSQLSATLAANNARLIDLKPYDDAGTTKFVAIMISNTGADAKSWWWYINQTSTQVGTNLTANNGRLTCFERYQVGGVDRWATVMISNTGADNQSWGYFFGASSATIASNISTYGNRLYGLKKVATDSYDVVLLHNPGYGWWYSFDQTASQVTETLQQNLARIIAIERRPTLLGVVYNVVMIDNANPLEQAARQDFYAAAPNGLGKYGFYLKEVNGPVLAEMRANTTFEPASTMKTLYHVHAMHQVLLGFASLNQQINKPLSCGVSGSNQSLSVTLREMMENSDNYSTLGVGNFFGLNNINNTAAALGMSSTHINFTIGCTGPSPESTLTLHDLTTLHEQVANGYLGAQRDTFYELMANGAADGHPFPSWGATTLDAKINAQATVLGMPAAVRDAFKSSLRLAYKPGGIGWAPGGVSTYYYAEGGWVSVPFKNVAGVITPKEYTFGVFDYLFTGAVNEVPGRLAMSAAELELVWNRVQAAMATWDNHIAGSLVPLSGAGCAGALGSPLHQASGTPEIANSVVYNLSNVQPLTLSVAMFGFDNTAWNGVPLPINLAPVGAPGCLLRIDAVVLDPLLTSAGGTAFRTLTFANNPSLIGAQLYTQYLVSEPSANAFGWTISNAIRTTLGGWL